MTYEGINFPKIFKKRGFSLFSSEEIHDRTRKFMINVRVEETGKPIMSS